MHENQRSKSGLAAAILLLTCIPAIAAPPMVPYTKKWDVKLESLPPSQVLTRLDLDRPGLEPVKTAAATGDQKRALAELLRYYRAKYPPVPVETGASPRDFPAADRICRHVFQWGPYEPADYGAQIDWTIDPANDIEWVAAVYRFYWVNDLTRAYAATHDEKYARAFVELTTDWIAKHPLEDWTRSHPTLTNWKGFAWLDLQTGIRATNAVTAFKTMLHAEAVTPDFLGIFLASMYDHLYKTEQVPMGMIHNKAVFEQRGVLSVCHAFPEFKDAGRWASLAFERAEENLLAQTTEEGVQREWCGGYHLAVLRDGMDMMVKARDLGVAVPEAFRTRVRGMCDYVFAMATPDLAWPMFGDTGRSVPASKAPRDGQLHGSLLHFGEFWQDPKYTARANVKEESLPDQASFAFGTAGAYVMRSRWGSDGIYLAVHCPPPGISGHDQPDNGTFELYAYGRWLMTDSGYYTYGHDKQARSWHRQTRVHQTMTLNREDAKIDGRLRLWHASPGLDTLVVENPSYNGLVHRRTIWFVNRQVFVFLDEAIGNAPGQLRVHWTPAPGEIRQNDGGTTFTTRFEDSNVLVRTVTPRSAPFEAEEGWFAWDYGRRQPRQALSVKQPGTAPAAFLAVVAPYRGTDPPDVDAGFVGGFEAGGEEARVTLRAFGKAWQIGRSLDRQQAWCNPLDASAGGS